MIKKKISVEKSEKDIIQKAMSSSDNEKLDLLKFVLGGLEEDRVCNKPPEFYAYADGTYVRHNE